MTRRKELEKEGWKRMFSASEPRLSESVEMYESLGYEVRLEDMEVENGEECGECLKGFEESVKVIYIRPRRSE